MAARQITPLLSITTIATQPMIIVEGPIRVVRVIRTAGQVGIGGVTARQAQVLIQAVGIPVDPTIIAGTVQAQVPIPAVGIQVDLILAVGIQVDLILAVGIQVDLILVVGIQVDLILAAIGKRRVIYVR